MIESSSSTTPLKQGDNHKYAGTPDPSPDSPTVSLSDFPFKFEEDEEKDPVDYEPPMPPMYNTPHHVRSMSQNVMKSNTLMHTILNDQLCNNHADVILLQEL
jgi:hypothetical protein